MENIRPLLLTWMLLVVLSMTLIQAAHTQEFDPCRDCIVVQNIYNSYPFTCDTDVVDAINWDCFNSMLFNTTRWYDRYKIVHNYTPENDPFCTCSAFWNEFSPCGYSNNPPFVRRDFSAIVPPCTAISWLITIRGKRGFQQIQCADGRLFVRNLEECPVTIEVSPPIRIPLNPERCCPSWVPVFPVNPIEESNRG
jgi:hypothetical protein